MQRYRQICPRTLRLLWSNFYTKWHPIGDRTSAKAPSVLLAEVFFTFRRPKDFFRTTHCSDFAGKKSASPSILNVRVRCCARRNFRSGKTRVRQFARHGFTIAMSAYVHLHQMRNTGSRVRCICCLRKHDEQSEQAAAFYAAGYGDRWSSFRAQLSAR